MPRQKKAKSWSKQIFFRRDEAGTETLTMPTIVAKDAGLVPEDHGWSFYSIDDANHDAEGRCELTTWRRG